MTSQQTAEQLKHGSLKEVFNVEKIRADFPQILQTKVRGKDLVYFDNAATTLKPACVVKTLSDFYQFQMANVHRGVHYLSEEGTILYESARDKIKEFIGAREREEIIFTRGTTESINLVTNSYGRPFLKAGDEVIISEMEHHSNIVPWQILCEQKNLKLKVIPMNDDGELVLEEYEKLLTGRTRIVSVVYISNSLGTINPVKEIIDSAHKRGAIAVIDAAQTVAHRPINVRDLDCDFLAFSGHKIFGPTGVGVLYGKKGILEKMPPFLGGGDMIDTVTFEKTTYNVLPHKFEAGTPHIAGVIGLAAAIDYVNSIGLEKIFAHEMDVLCYATDELLTLEGVRILGTARKKGPVLQFVVEGVHPHDIGTLIDMEGVAIRTGHHCTQPVLRHFGVTASARASFSVYNTKEEVNVFMKALKKVRGML